MTYRWNVYTLIVRLHSSWCVNVCHQKHQREVSQLQDLLRERSKENRRLKSSFDAIKQLNDNMKKQVRSVHTCRLWLSDVFQSFLQGLIKSYNILQIHEQKAKMLPCVDKQPYLETVSQLLNTLNLTRRSSDFSSRIKATICNFMATSALKMKLSLICHTKRQFSWAGSYFVVKMSSGFPSDVLRLLCLDSVIDGVSWRQHVGCLQTGQLLGTDLLNKRPQTDRENVEHHKENERAFSS